METLPYFKNRRNSEELTPSRFIVGCTFTLFLLVMGIGTFLALQNLESTLREIENAPIDPQRPCPLAFISFDAERQIQIDPLTKSEAATHRLERRVTQYRKLTSYEDLIPIPMTSEPNELSERPHKELSLWSKAFSPEFYFDGFYKIRSHAISLETFTMRNDLVFIPTSPFGRWVKIAPNSLFLGTNPKKPQDGQYKIDYYSYVLEKSIILGRIDSSGEIIPRKIFMDNPKLEHPKNQIISQILRFKTSVLSVNLIVMTILILLVIRENTHPKTSAELLRKISFYSQYDLIFSPLVLLIPQTHLGAMIFCLALMIYGTCKIFLRKAMALIESERINLYR